MHCESLIRIYYTFIINSWKQKCKKLIPISYFYIKIPEIVYEFWWIRLKMACRTCSVTIYFSQKIHFFRENFKSGHICSSLFCSEHTVVLQHYESGLLFLNWPEIKCMHFLFRRSANHARILMEGSQTGWTILQRGASIVVCQSHKIHSRLDMPTPVQFFLLFIPSYHAK